MTVQYVITSGFVDDVMFLHNELMAAPGAKSDVYDCFVIRT